MARARGHPAARHIKRTAGVGGRALSDNTLVRYGVSYKEGCVDIDTPPCKITRWTYLTCLTGRGLYHNVSKTLKQVELAQSASHTVDYACGELAFTVI